MKDGNIIKSNLNEDEIKDIKNNKEYNDIIKLYQEKLFPEYSSIIKL